MRNASFRSRLRFAPTLAVVLSATPAAGYRVFLDHDTDNDLTTFVNVVEGPVSAPIKVVVAFGAEDVGVSEFGFAIEWPCQQEPFQCPIWRGGINVTDVNLPNMFPFFGGSVQICLSFLCDCLGSLGYYTYVVTPPPVGNWLLAEHEFTRAGFVPGCNTCIGNCPPWNYSEVEFRVVCSSCNYQPGDEARTRMVLRESPTPVGSSTWGRIKAIYGGGPEPQ